MSKKAKKIESKKLEPTTFMSEDVIIPPKLKAYMDEHKEELKKLHKEWISNPDAHMGGNTELMGSSDPPVFVKFGIQRFYNANRLRKVIDKYKLNLLRIPPKYIYSLIDIDEAKEKKEHVFTDANSLVVSICVDGDIGFDSELGTEQIKQLYTFVTKGQYYRLHRFNYIIDKNGIVHIIDTGDQEVLQKKEAIEKRLDYIKNGNGMHNGPGVRMDPPINDPLTQLELCMYSKHAFLNNDAYTWLNTKLEEREEERRQYKKKLKNNSKLTLEFDDDLFD